MLKDDELQESQNFIWGNSLISTTNAKHKSYVMAEAQSYRYLHDHLGSPIRMINSAIHKPRIHESQHNKRFTYDEFGNDVEDNYFFANPFGFTGYMHDDVTGDLFAQAREYNPKIGRFTAQDIIKGTLEEPFTHNQYNYAWGRPLNFVDLDGMRPRNHQYEDTEVWLVHGTVFPGKSSDHFTEEFKQYLMGELNIPRENIHVPYWGGNLNLNVREREGHSLANEINSTITNPNTNVLVIEYSHGGNVAIRSLNRLHDHYNFNLNNTAFIAVGTPRRRDYRLSRGALNNLGYNINVFNDVDSVQRAGTLHANPFRNAETIGII